MDSKAPLSTSDYPKYFKTKDALLAFIKPSEVYVISNRGSNSGNIGIVIDFYKTRKMVLSYWPYPYYAPITADQFRAIYNQLFKAYLDKIIIHF